MSEANKKLAVLKALLQSYGSCLVAYSGGVDSVFLARVAHDTLGNRALAAIADSPSLPRRELQEALDIAAKFKFPVRVIKTQEFANENYTANPANRCYFCKHELFEELTPLAKAEKFAVIAYGENASDIGDFRPGAQAAAKFQVRAPLKETVTPEKLRMIEQAEYVLRDLGFHDVRVRHHEMKVASDKLQVTDIHRALEINPVTRHPSPVTHFARIELAPVEIPSLLANGKLATVAEALKKIGSAHVTLDLQGYRRGSTNEILPKRAT